MSVNQSTKVATVATEFDFASAGVGDIPDTILLAIQGSAVVWISLGDNESELLAAARVRFPAMLQNKNSPAIAQAIEQLQGLLAQPTSTWEIPLDLQGTEFQKLVWSAIAKIPVGTTMTYQQLATSIGRKSSVRAVASATAGACSAKKHCWPLKLNRNRLSSKSKPWHQVAPTTKMTKLMANRENHLLVIRTIEQ